MPLSDGSVGSRTVRVAVSAVVAAAALSACSTSPVEVVALVPARSSAPADRIDADLWLSFDTDTVAYDGALAFPVTSPGSIVATVVSANGGAVQQVAGADGDGTAVAFPARCGSVRGCPRAMVEIPSDPALDPGEADFAYGATVWLADDQATHGSNIVQQGRFATRGGQWKLQVDNVEGQPSCVVRGREFGMAPVVVRSDVSIADSHWHRVVCRRLGESLSIDVDGHVTQRSGRIGAVAIPAPIRIGSPGVDDGDDQFSGRVDDVFVRLAGPR